MASWLGEAQGEVILVALGNVSPRAPSCEAVCGRLSSGGFSGPARYTSRYADSATMSAQLEPRGLCR